MDNIVISGVSGRFPEANNIEEFAKNLFDGVDMVTEDDRRWTPGLYGLPRRHGKLKDVARFDAAFFNISAKQVNNMDPQLRILLECAYEAIVDAGLNPKELRGTNTGVYIGTSFSDAQISYSSDINNIQGYTMSGTTLSMFANRLSFYFDLKGPSQTIDTACSSTFYAFENAYKAIKSGVCECALVGGAHLTFRPQCSLQFMRLNMLSMDGKCRSFDADGSGYVRSETIGVFLLQKRQAARRFYAQIMNVKCNNDGWKADGITFPSSHMQKTLMKTVYEESNIDPESVVYYEAHGTGTKAGDPQELNAVTEVFCKNRRSSLLIGSVKSNCGHAEPASGVASISKVLIAINYGIIPPNLHFETPNPNIPGLLDKRLEIVTSATRLPPGYIALNSSGFGGSNGHILLKAVDDDNNEANENTTFPLSSQLLYVSSRTEDGVRNALAYLTEKKQPSLQFLYNSCLFEDAFSQPYRGFTVLNGSKNFTEIAKMRSVQDRPVWFIFSGMGTHWYKMGRKLLEIRTFANSLEQSDSLLKPYGIELLNNLLTADESVWKCVTNTFIGIAAIQIALVDCLRKLGINPDGIIGHSVGELGCAYADGCFTAEETLLAAYYRGKCIEDANLALGAMAAVGLSWEECLRQCPEGVYPACHNSKDTVTISGAKEKVESFVSELQERGVFAKSVDSLGVAFHSPVMISIAPNLKAALERVLKSNKMRSSKWISSSVNAQLWDTELAKYSSPDYHANNLCSPVLFQEALTFIPENAIIIEIAPHCLLQAVLKRSVPSSCNSFGLMKKGEDDLYFFFTTLGRLYNEGLKFDFFALLDFLPKLVKAPFLSPVVNWEHSATWNYPYADKDFENSGGKSKFVIDLNDQAWNFLKGHRINDRIIFPATGYLVLVWKCFSKTLNNDFDKTPVQFSEVEFVRATILTFETPVILYVSLLHNSGTFQIEESNSIVVRGKIAAFEDSRDVNKHDIPNINDKNLSLTDDIYKELSIRGYDYQDVFRCINSIDCDGINGYLEWNNNWVPYLDSLLQFVVLSEDGLKVPSRIEFFKVEPQVHMMKLIERDNKHLFPVSFDKNCNVVSSGGVYIRGLHSASLSKKIVKQSVNLTVGSVELLNETIVSTSELLTDHSDHPVNGLSSNSIDTNSGKYENGASTDEDATVKKFSNILSLNNVIEKSFSFVFQSVGRSCTICEVCFDKCSLFHPLNEMLENLGISLMQYTCISSLSKEVFEFPDTVTFVKCNETSELCSLITDSSLTIFNFGSDNFNAARIEEEVEKSGVNSATLVMYKHTSDETPCIDNDDDESRLQAEQLRKRFSFQNYIHISTLMDNLNGAIIFRRKVEGHYCVINVDDTFTWVDALKSELNKDVERVWLLSTDANSGLLGFFNTLRMEPNGHKLRCILADKISANVPELLNTIMDADLLVTILKDCQIGFYMYRNYDAAIKPYESEFSYVNVLNRGDLSSLTWLFAENPYVNNEDSVNVNVHFAALNFRDVMLATGKLLPDAIPGYKKLRGCLLGIEFSGTTRKNIRVMGLAPGRAMASDIVVNNSFIFEVPPSWTLEDAATVPVVYCTAFYSLIIRGKLKRGERVLIHAGSGGVGIAAIRIALSLECEVFTTVSTTEKRNFLKNLFPSLHDDHIFCSRNASFEEDIMHATSGYGVDVVLNSLAGELLQASVRVLHEHGRFLEIGKYDLQMNTALGMSFFLKNTSFHGILLDALFEKGNDDWHSVRKCLVEGINSGVVVPLPHKIFDCESVEAAFRFMAQGKHIGKIIIKVKREDRVMHSAIPQLWFHPNKSYLVTGGLGDLGLEITRFLLDRGARHVYLTSRSGIKTVYQTRKLMLFKEQYDDANVVAVKNDLQTSEKCDELLSLINADCPLAGVFHLAGILRDRLFENQTENDFNEVYCSKFRTAALLDVATRSLSLDYFVVFSSVAAGLGNPGQSNYAFANSALDRLCETRTREGFPSISIQWGPIDDVGMFANLKKGFGTNIIGQKLESMLQVFEKILLDKQLNTDLKQSVFMSYVLNEPSSESETSATKRSLLEIVSGILGITDATTFNPDATLAELGIDSLGSVEVGQILEKHYGLHLSGKEIQALKISDLFSMDTEVTPCTVSSHPSVIVPKEILVKMNDVDNKTPLFVIHPIEGYVDALKEVMSLVKTPVYGLQCTDEVPLDSMYSTAEYYYARICEIYPSGDFFIAGYSFGTCVAFEIAHLASTRVKKIIFLDGSPRYILEHTRDFFKKQENNQQIEIEAFYFFDTVIRVNREKAFEALLAHSDPALRSKILHEMCEEMGFKDPLTIRALQLYIDRIFIAFYYTPKILNENIPVTLVKANDNADLNSKVGHDYDLSAICKLPPAVVTLDGDHRSFITRNKGMDLAEVLNKEIESQ